MAFTDPYQIPTTGLFQPTAPTAPTGPQGPAGSNVPSASQSGGTSWWGKMSPEAQGALINAGAQIGGGILQGVGQDKQNQAQMDFNYAKLRQDASDSAASRTIQAAQSNPLAIQAQRQKMALMGAIMPGLRNAHVSSNIPGMNQFIPQMSGGFRLPENGLPQNVLDMYSPQNVANAEGEFWKQMSGSVMPQDLTKVGYGAAGQAGTDTAMQAYQQQHLSPQAGAVQQMLGPQSGPAPQGYHWHDGKLSKDGSGFWHKLAKFGGIAGAGLATAFTGGAASPLLAAAIGAGGGALSGWGSGGGLKSTLLGAGLGGAMGGIGAELRGGAQGVQGAVNQVEHQALGAGQGVGSRVLGSLGQSFFPQGGGSSFAPQPGQTQQNWQQMMAPILQILQHQGQPQPQQASGTNWAQVIQQLLAMQHPQIPVMYAQGAH